MLRISCTRVNEYLAWNAFKDGKEPKLKLQIQLLSACRIHGNVGLGQLAAAKLLKLSPRISGNYVSIIYY